MQRLFFWRTDLGSNVLALKPLVVTIKGDLWYIHRRSRIKWHQLWQKEFRKKNKIIEIVIILKKGNVCYVKVKNICRSLIATFLNLTIRPLGLELFYIMVCAGGAWGIFSIPPGRLKHVAVGCIINQLAIVTTLTKKIISGSLAIKKTCSHSCAMSKSGVRLPVPILLVWVYSFKRSKLVYVLIVIPVSDSKESLISRGLFLKSLN